MRLFTHCVHGRLETHCLNGCERLPIHDCDGGPNSSTCYAPIAVEFDVLARAEGYVHVSDLAVMKWCDTHSQPADEPTDETCHLIETGPRLLVYIGEDELQVGEGR